MLQTDLRTGSAEFIASGRAGDLNIDQTIFELRKTEIGKSRSKTKPNSKINSNISSR